MTVPNPPEHRRVPVQRRRVSGVEHIHGLPLITVSLDRDGLAADGTWWTLLSGLDIVRATDLVVLAHGHNAPGSSAWRRPSLTRSFLAPLPALLEHGRSGRRPAFLDLRWPARRWADELRPGDDAWSPAPGGFEPPPSPCADTWQATLAAFEPANRQKVDELLSLLALRPDDVASLRRARRLIRDLAQAGPGGARAAGGGGDVASVLELDDPHPEQLFADFGLRLAELGVVTDPAGGPAGFGDSVARLWHGAQEATRQLAYRRLEARAARVGELGLGPLLARLHAARPEIGLNLVGHGLGATLAGHALRALPEPPAGDPGGAPIRSVTLLQAVLPDTAFADKLPSDTSSPGLLAGLDERVAGAVTACYSRHDSSLGSFYPLAARTAGPVPADGPAALGHHGHRPGARELPLNRPGVAYDPAGPGLTGPGLVSIDASRVVRHGRPPGGAHADVCHPELGWVVLSAAGVC